MSGEKARVRRVCAKGVAASAIMVVVEVREVAVGGWGLLLS